MIGKLRTFRNKLVTGLAALVLASGIVLTSKKADTYETGNMNNLPDNLSIHPLLVNELADFFIPQGVDFLVRSVQEGSINEDSPDEPGRKQYSRALNHFQHWRTGKALECDFDYCNTIRPQGVENFLSSKEWAQNPEAQAKYPFGDHTWERVKDDYRLGIVGEHFGFVYHLIADLTVPAHVRNDTHPFPGDLDDYEWWTNKNKDTIMASVKPQSISQFSSLDKLMTSLAHFTGSNFYSDDSRDGTIGRLATVTQNNAVYLVKDVEGKQTRMLRVASVINFQDDNCLSDQWHVLGTKTVEYGAAALQLLEREVQDSIPVCTPTPEICDRQDNDCDGETDEDAGETYYLDQDGDGYGMSTHTKKSCSRPDGYAPVGGDCHDHNSNIHPEAEEVCDGLDNNCTDGLHDEGDAIFYLDSDGDGYGDSNLTTMDCSLPNGYSPLGGDCDDLNIYINPEAEEVCDDVDNNCLNGVDEMLTNTYFADRDRDGYGNRSDWLVACAEPEGYIAVANNSNFDCDDDNNNANPGVISMGTLNLRMQEIFWQCDSSFSQADGDWNGDSCVDEADVSLFWDNLYPENPQNYGMCDSKDNDCDGETDEDFGLGETCFTGTGKCRTEGVIACGNSPDSPYPGGTTCSAEPSSPLDEICDGEDNDCDGITDEETGNVYFFDQDGDGYGSTASTISCSQPENYVDNNRDCDDGNANINPGIVAYKKYLIHMEETGGYHICDPLHPDSFEDGDFNGDGCFDYIDVGDLIDAALDHSESFELCGDPDKNCDGIVNEGWLGLGQECRSLGTGECVTSGTYGCDSIGMNLQCSSSEGSPTPEICNGLDDDCDHLIDESVKITYYLDADGDDYGTTALTMQGCQASTGYVNRSGDCDDTNPNIKPDGVEICNGLNDDCDGETDEGVTTIYYRDQDSDGFGDPNVSTPACQLPTGYVTNNRDCNDNYATLNPNAREVWDLVDNNCNGANNEGLCQPGTTAGCGGECVAGQKVCDSQGYWGSCSGAVDETTYCRDADGDGYGRSSDCRDSCTTLSGRVTNSDDCNDSNFAIKPGATELCDGIDNNCVSGIDENYNIGSNCTAGTGACQRTGTRVCAASKLESICNAVAGQPSTEVCDQVDNDCDGQTDETCVGTCLDDYLEDNDNFDTAVVVMPGVTYSNLKICNGDADYFKIYSVANTRTEFYITLEDTPNNMMHFKAYDSQHNLLPDADIDFGGHPQWDDYAQFWAPSTDIYYIKFSKSWYNRWDQDSRYSFYSSSYTPPACQDSDGDSYGGGCAYGPDCNDNNSSINPGATEILNGLDDNCNGQMDEGLEGIHAGNPQITLMWSGAADIDLHVHTPSGCEMYWGNRSCGSGTLDRDARRLCNSTLPPENIAWASTPPSGTYTVKVQYYKSCNGSGPTNAIVRISQNGVITPYPIPLNSECTGTNQDCQIRVTDITIP